MHVPACRGPCRCGVDEVTHVGFAVALGHAAHADFVRQHRAWRRGRRPPGPGCRCRRSLPCEVGAGGDDGVVGAERAARSVGRSLVLQRQAGRLELAVARMHDHVAADHRQAAVGAVEADVLGAVAVDDDVARRRRRRRRRAARRAVARRAGPWRAGRPGSRTCAAKAGAARTASAASMATLSRRACKCIRWNP